MQNYEFFLEIGKFLLDLFKQLIALDTAMLATIVAIVEKVFQTEKVIKHKVSLLLLILSLSSIFLSLLLSMFSMQTVINNMSLMLQGAGGDKWINDGLFYGSIYTFVVGILLFLILAGVNFVKTNPTSGNKVHRK
jgi:multisubunit Na+/H+ antiporter MnhB subunit